MNIKIRWKSLEYSTRRGLSYLFCPILFFFFSCFSCFMFLFDSILLVSGGILTLHETLERFWGWEMSPERSVPACLPSRLLTSSHSSSPRSSHGVSRGQPTGSNKLPPGHWQHISHTPVNPPPVTLPRHMAAAVAAILCQWVWWLYQRRTDDQTKLEKKNISTWKDNSHHVSVCRNTNKVKKLNSKLFHFHSWPRLE